MSFLPRISSSLNSPPLVATAGAAIVIGLPFVEQFLSASTSLTLLKSLNVAAFVTNVLAVSVPGRIDGKQDDSMRSGNLNPSSTSDESAPLASQSAPGQPQASSSPASLVAYERARERSLVNPSGWAFAIWGPIYLGEAAFVGAQCFDSTGLSTILPQITGPFFAANMLQSLWCASFRTAYYNADSSPWHRYVSVGMLGGTAYSLSLVNTIALDYVNTWSGFYFLPMTIHFGWMTAATLVNLNGSICMPGSLFSSSTSPPNDSVVIGVGHASVITATALGIGITITQALPAYGLTIAWALCAVADQMSKRQKLIQEHRQEQNASDDSNNENHACSTALQTGLTVQKYLCWTGSAGCVAASILALNNVSIF